MADARNILTAAARSRALRAERASGMFTDISEVVKALEKMNESVAISMARSMAVAGGKVIRDDAKMRVPTRTDTLYNALYLAYRDKSKGTRQARYSVSWNSKKAPHGHLVEFGYVQVYRVHVNENGRFWTDKSQRLPEPRYVPGNSFLRAAFEATTARAQKAMMDRGRERWREIMGELHGNTE